VSAEEAAINFLPLNWWCRTIENDGLEKEATPSSQRHKTTRSSNKKNILLHSLVELVVDGTDRQMSLLQEFDGQRLDFSGW
jgi:hypothetical protein